MSDGLDLKKSDLLGGGSSGKAVPTSEGDMSKEAVRQAVDSQLGSPDIATHQGQRSQSSANMLREVRGTVNEFNKLIQELKSNPQLAQALTGGGSQQAQNQQQRPQQKRKEKANTMELPDSITEDQAFQLFKTGISELRGALGDEMTLQQAEQTLEIHEDRVKQKLAEVMSSSSRSGQQGGQSQEANSTPGNLESQNAESSGAQYSDNQEDYTDIQKQAEQEQKKASGGLGKNLLEEGQ